METTVQTRRPVLGYCAIACAVAALMMSAVPVLLFLFVLNDPHGGVLLVLALAALLLMHPLQLIEFSSPVALMAIFTALIALGMKHEKPAWPAVVSLILSIAPLFWLFVPLFRHG